MNFQKISVYLFSLLLAFCSLFYEYVYGQLMAICLGGTKAQYLLVISLFTCALGLGSLIHQHLTNRMGLLKVFFCAEVFLTILGSTGPFLIAWILRPDEGSISFLNILVSYSIVFLIGLLSGLEIPSLFALMKDSQGKILAWDYLGMLLASLLFPFFFLPKLGTAAGTLFVANINVIAVIWLVPLPRSIKLCAGGVNLFLFYFVLEHEVVLNQFLSTVYLGER